MSKIDINSKWYQECYQDYLSEVKSYGGSIQFIPNEYKTPELCNIAIINYGSSLNFIPKKLITKELCEVAVSNYGYALQYVPNKFKTPEICKISLTKWGSALEFVPEDLKTYELCEFAVKHYGGALEFVPKKILNLDMCMAAIKINYPSALEYIEKWVPEEYQEELVNIYNNNLQARKNKKELLASKFENFSEEVSDLDLSSYGNDVKNARVYLNFNCKPSNEILCTLRSNGFNWSRTEKIWYRPTTRAAFKALKNVLLSYDITIKDAEEFKIEKK